MKVYVRVDLNDDQLQRLYEKASQTMDVPPEDTPPKVVVNVYEGTEVAESHLVHPVILKVTDEATGANGEVILRGEVYSTGKDFRFSID